MTDTAPALFPLPTQASPVNRPREGWTPWARGRNQINHCYGPTRQFHWPKNNATDHYRGAELVGEEAWGIHGSKWRMKKPEPGQEPYKPDPAMLKQRWEAAVAEFRAMKVREREEAEAKAIREANI